MIYLLKPQFRMDFQLPRVNTGGYSRKSRWMQGAMYKPSEAQLIAGSCSLGTERKNMKKNVPDTFARNGEVFLH